MGTEVGDFVRALRRGAPACRLSPREHGAIHRPKATLSRITLPADLVVAGIGVRPRTELAEKAGITVDRGVVVDEYLKTNAAGVLAAGDICSVAGSAPGQKAEGRSLRGRKTGQIAARNMLGQRVPCKFVPFFWSQHYDVSISYVGHAKRWDRTDVSGSVSGRDCTVALRAGNKTLAVITIGRDAESLRAEVAFERDDARTLAAFATS
jgi:NADPH-dependent 2,4-dienoyl-CoA reductase/sulfur reductase-like enzyme